MEFVGLVSNAGVNAQPRPATPAWIPRPKGWASYSLTDTLAASVTITLPPTITTQLGLQWNPIRSRYVDVAGLVRASLEAWMEPVLAESGYCQEDHGVGALWYAHSSAVGLVGFNIGPWLTLQAQGGVWVQKGFDWRAG